MLDMALVHKRSASFWILCDGFSGLVRCEKVGLHTILYYGSNKGPLDRK